MSALIFDRTQADADRAAYLIRKIHDGETLTESEQAEYFAGLKGCYNIADLNRVEAKVRELVEVLRKYGYSVDYTVPLKGASALPAGYTQLEYLQSTGTQYIDTGFIPDQDTRVVCKTVCEVLSASNYVFGARTSGSSNRFDFFASSAKGCYYTAFNTTSNPFPASLVTSEPFVVDKNRNVTTIDGGNTVTNTEYTFTAPVNLVLFGVNSNGAITYGQVKLYSVQIYDNDTLIRNMIPARNINGILGMYDTVNKKFYQNSGTGTFNAGAEIGAIEDREWRYGDTMLESDVLLYLANIAALRNVIQLPPDVPPIPTTDQWISWIAANNIEQIVYELDRYIYGIVPLFRRSGTFRAGKNAQHLLLAEGVN